MDYTFFQHYWWLLVSLLGAILVFLLFVQGGQSLLLTIGKSEDDKRLIINSLGRKWEFTFTTLVTFGGAFFASFPLFYSTSFGGAYYVWLAILLVFVIQAVAFEFRSKEGNFLGSKTYDVFLLINGSVAPLLIGTAVGTFFTGANFSVDFFNITHGGAISQWTTPWHGLEAVLDYRNLALGAAVLFLARSLGLQYFINNIDDNEIVRRSRVQLPVEVVSFLVFFLTFLVSILFASGYAVGEDGIVVIEEYKYLTNFLQMPVVMLVFLAGVVGVLWGFGVSLFTSSRGGIWFSGVGTVLAVLGLLLNVGYNNTCYYPSLADPQSSLTIANSSSSLFTLQAMSIVSLFIPIVLGYIWYAWRSMNSRPISKAEIAEDPEHNY
ncbi:Cytochrome d ubiquinol oxidase subunit II [Mucinivorans hirudinis]|uniref:Cytochrome d ubiquinol oxidase subunit II n=1 Tax=Mucinivorans hirudinis TaxID=1433126 RepID=A0A060R7U5_9BACT|nr:Cytochrome d ubiquinol oxidase subunit II [Mucinivorans hirudinis]